MTILHEKTRFRDYLEQIIFRREELKEIKILISEVCEGNQPQEQLKSKLLEYRARMLNDIADFTDFYIEKIFQESNFRDSENKANLFTVSNFKAQLNHHLKTLDIPKWLDSVRKCILSYNPLIRNKEKFVDEFWGRLEEYHRSEIGIQRKSMPDKIKDFSFPQFLETKLIQLNMIRNKKSHQRYELTEQQEFAFYSSYFMLLSHRINTTFSQDPQFDDIMIQELKDYFAFPFKDDLRLCRCIRNAITHYFHHIRRGIK